MTIRFLFATAATLALAACGGSRADIDQTGARPDLPDQRQTLLPPMKIATPEGWNGEQPIAPAGFTVTALATDLKVPRQLLVLPNGDILVAEGSGGSAPTLRPKDVIAGYIKGLGKTPVKGGNQITLLRDADGDGKAELRTAFITGLNAPYGLAYVDGNIYVAAQDALLRFPYRDGMTRITLRGQEITKLPGRVNHHWTKALTAGPDGSKLYVGIGSNSNVGERGLAIEEDRAVIWEVDRQTGAHRIYASGIRNPTALAIHPQTRALWAVVNERDELGPLLVPDYMTAVRPGAFYGWPYSYWGQNIDPRVHPQKPDMVRRAIRPDYALGSHVAALGISFPAGQGLGRGFIDGVFVGQHGSWNRQDLAGYKVVWIPFANGRPAGKPQDFLTGFIKGDHARGRPVGVTYDPISGALLVADDLSNTVWRINRRER
ncbi:MULTISPECIES: PQQ-dependent sugar dehydrogenase [Sphingobium]|uniref:Sorbosone dehydrogenase n=2 Tax=Sphingobium cupriresistens TaxID=1132417 RepID=A0A0J7Y2K0_9SPHN|nr:MULTISPECIES: sorbosone dehydrogenase family protein [Sphingobium]KMS58161.1 sorbosone dehydrogenase [Sphingobium cupriresistens LL01]MBJ7377356.1 sorbosone dehydrogenase family protein [Sphingobium sp.]RYM06256.1 sorbosone dehydrogenase family protein [Sphingobium cupriresistens]